MPTARATLSSLSSPFSNSFSVLSDESLHDSPLYFDFESSNISPTHSQCISSVSLYSYSIPTLSVKLLDSAVQLPTRGSVSTSGYDLYSFQYSIIPTWSHKPINIGIAIAFPSGLYAREAPHLGLTLRCIYVSAGVTEEDFGAPVKSVLINQSDTSFRINRGD